MNAESSKKSLHSESAGNLICCGEMGVAPQKTCTGCREGIRNKLPTVQIILRERACRKSYYP